MHLVEQYSATQPPISAVGDHWLEIEGQRWQQSVLLGPSLITAFVGSAVDDLDLAALQPALDLQPEVLLLATGPRLRFPATELRMQLLAKAVGLEVMDHRAAARTYNLLVSEGRRTVAVFLINAPADQTEVK